MRRLHDRTTRHTRRTAGVGATLAVLALVTAGCSSGSDSAGSSGSTSSTTTQSPSATPSTTTSAAPSTTEQVGPQVPSPSATVAPGDPAAGERGLQALLPEGAMKKVGYSYTNQPAAGVWAWYDACGGRLPSNAQIVGGAHARWTDSVSTIDQVVAYYPNDGAGEAVSQAEALTKCANWSFPDGTKVTGVKAHKLDKVGGLSGQFSWCESIKAVTRCTAVVSAGNTVTRLWVLASPATEAEQTINTFATLASARILSQPS